MAPLIVTRQLRVPPPKANAPLTPQAASTTCFRPPTITAGDLSHPHVEWSSINGDPPGSCHPCNGTSGKIGINIVQECPKPWTQEIVQAADVVITMGCGDACPIFPGTRYEDWDLDDPAGLDVAAVRPIRDEIGKRVRTLPDSLGVPTRA
jgi:hypothetical protein